MYLKSLVLKGFKSFADRSVLAMEPGVTAVVGPNGSGKSNISDAVLWVLGERNAKHLRGQAMEDVIFAGSSARKSVGLAEVDLILDNSDGTIPVEYDEVAITRRMYRSGESEYLINGTIVRRMDVLDILHDSGLGSGTHSIISQGSLDSILQSKPEDRRALIEEAAGVLKHKQRKAKSERKLAAMDIHLSRIKDVTAEVERQLAPLERKAKRAITYQELKVQLDELSLALAVDDLRVLQKKWNDVQVQERGLEEELEQKRLVLQASQSQVESLQEKIRCESLDVGKIAQEHRSALSAVERFDGATLVLREKKRAAQNYEKELLASLESDKEKQIQAELERVQALDQLTESTKERAAADLEVAQFLSQQQENTTKRQAVERELEELERARKTDESAREQSRKELAQTQEALSRGLAHVQLIEGRNKELLIQFEGAQADADVLVKALVDTDALCTDLTQREADARTRVGAALAAREAARVEYDEARDEVLVLSSQIKGLEEVERAFVAASGPALTWLRQHEEELNVSLTPLAHALRVSQGFESLVEQLLGSDVSALLVHDDSLVDVVASALLSCDKQGEVVLVSASPASGGSLPGRIAADAGLGEALIDKLDYPKENVDAIESLLGDVVVCSSRDEALNARLKNTMGARFVSLDGCVVWPQGKITVGAHLDQDGEGVLARARRLEELRRLLEVSRVRCDKAETSSNETEASLRKAQSESLKLSQELAEVRGKAQSARKEASRAEEKLASIRRELSDIDQKRTQAENSVAETRPHVDALENRLKTLSQKVGEGATRLEVIKEAVVPLRKQAAQIRDTLAEVKLKAATLTERETYMSRMVDARVRDLEIIKVNNVKSLELLERKRVAQKRVEPLLILLDELLLNAQRWTSQLEKAADDAQSSSAGLHGAVHEARLAARKAQESLDGVNTRISELRVEKGRLEIQVDAAVQSIVHDCSTPLDRALDIPELENRGEAEDASFKLKRRIANMGTINPDAAEEFKQLQVRYSYLAHQVADLESARQSIAKIVRVIDARMKDDFIRTYEAVDKNFQEIFAVLFPGGSAHLTLDNPDDLNATGVEVSAQPRGKRITKMMLMSGGEKSLTALALLFAVYRIRTTPFYILDEVEAALDDSNLRRLTAYLDTLRDSTQLIMITHQRRTMEMADVLFGVSMHSDGVTKVVSQKLDRALQYAEG